MKTRLRAAHILKTFCFSPPALRLPWSCTRFEPVFATPRGERYTGRA